MKLKITKKNIQRIIHVVLFACTVFLIFQLLPNREHFRYHFQIGKPWYYELLTASFDFPIYKSDVELNEERDSVLRKLTPYFKIDTSVYVNQVTLFKSNVQLPERETDLILDKLKQIYDKGILGIQNKNRLVSENTERIAIVQGTKLHFISREDVFTPRSAYEYLFLSLNQLSDKELKKINLSYYLSENLCYQEAPSQNSRAEALSAISLTSGLVQTGQRIIDKGEIVTPQIYQILYSLKKFTDEQNLSNRKEYAVILGEIFFIIGLLLLFCFYLFLFRPKIAESTKNMIFMSIMILLLVALTSFTIRFTKLSIYIVPFAIQPIIVRIFFDSRTALFTHIITVLLCACMVPFPMEFIVLQVTAGMTAVSSLKNLTQRSQLMRVAILVFVDYTVMYSALVLMTAGSFKEINVFNYLMFAINGLLLLFAYGLIYIFEKIFGFLSDITLVELSNVNNKLLVQFSEIASGSFQHSLQVSNLVSEAAKKINANVLLVRAGALYHDIGKMANPMIYTENQPESDNSPLSKLPYEQAAQMIISHVDDGVRIAEKNNLPKQVIDFIRTHHAKSVTRYFYNSYKNSYPDQPIPEDMFTYKGPLPNSKETALLMMADSVEATLKSLPEHNDEAIEKTVDKIIDAQIASGAFQDAPITFRHIATIKTVFKQKLKNIYHVRISYPEINKKESNR